MNEQTSMGGQPSAPRPGLMPISDLFKGAWAKYKQHAQVLIGIMLISGVGLYLQSILLWSAKSTVQVGANGAIITSGLAGMGTLALVATLTYIVGMIWGYSALLNKISKLNQPMGIQQAFMSAKPLIWPLFLTGLLAGIFTLIGIILLIIPGIIVGVFLSFALYIVVDENKKGMDALKASKAYVDGYWLPIFGRVLLMGIVIALIAGIIGGIAQAILGYNIGMLVQNVIGLAIAPFAVVYMYDLYKNVKQLKGGSAPMNM